MTEDWKEARDKSDDTFERLVWPVIGNACGGGHIIAATEFGAVGRWFDSWGGVDYWQFCSGEQKVRGLSTRVQYGDKNWESFTLRHSRLDGTPAEYLKHCNDIDTGDWLYPQYTCQAYVTRDATHLLGCGVARTADIYQAILMGAGSENSNPDGTKFIVVWWRDLNDIVIYDGDK